MIPKHISDYLGDFKVPYESCLRQAILSEEELPAGSAASGTCVVTPIMLEADGEKWMAVIPEKSRLDEAVVKRELGAKELRVLGESEVAGLFPECEPGSQPPFGRLYGLRVMVDASLAGEVTMVFSGGSRQEAIQMRYDDFRRRERPAELVLCHGCSTEHEAPIPS
jgi:Ala-tRNA(Pro) deacylase